MEAANEHAGHGDDLEGKLQKFHKFIQFTMSAVTTWDPRMSEFHEESKLVRW